MYIGGSTEVVVVAGREMTSGCEALIRIWRVGLPDSGIGGARTLSNNGVSLTGSAFVVGVSSSSSSSDELSSDESLLFPSFPSSSSLVANNACNRSPAPPPTPGSARARLTMSGVVGVSGGGVRSGEEGVEDVLGDLGGAGRRGGIVDAGVQLDGRM